MRTNKIGVFFQSRGFIAKSQLRKLIGISALLALLLVCLMGYYTEHYLYPNKAGVNRVDPAILLEFPDKYEGIEVMFPMRVEQIEEREDGIILKADKLKVWSSEVQLVRELYPSLEISVVGTCYIKSKGYVQADALYLHPYRIFPYITSLFALLFFIYYSSPMWLPRLRR